MKSEVFLLLVSLHTFSIFSKGKANSLPYVSTEGKCRNGSTEYNPSGSNLCCSKCNPGSRLVGVCSGENDTICGPCNKGTYSDSMTYHPNCFSCLTCPDHKGLMYSKNCSSGSNAECQCKPGLVCAVRQRGQRCSECKPPKVCPPGKGAKPGYFECVSCTEGTFSKETSTRPCQPHTKCEERGMGQLYPGNSRKDTTCGPLSTLPVTTTHHPQTQTTSRTQTTSDPTTMSSPSTFNLTESSRTTPRTEESVSNEYKSFYWIGPVVAIVILVLLMACTFAMCHRKDLPKPPVKEAEPVRASEAAFPYSKSEYQHLLDGKTDPSTSSSGSDSHSQSTGTSQDSIHTEQPVVSSPCVNVSITATFNCHVNPSTSSCSIPISPLAQPQPVQPDLPLSQEEQLHVSCEEENSKEALQSVQERGMTVFKA